MRLTHPQARPTVAPEKAIPWMGLRPMACVRRRKGYSLLEIIVVILIISVGTTIALYGYAGYRKDQALNTAAIRVQRALTFTRARAIDSRLAHRVVFDLENHSFWVDEFNAAGTAFRPKIVQEEYLENFVAFDRIEIGGTVFESGSGTAIVDFLPDGTCPYVLIYLRRDFDDVSDVRNTYTIRLFPGSGEAQVRIRERVP